MGQLHVCSLAAPPRPKHQTAARGHGPRTHRPKYSHVVFNSFDLQPQHTLMQPGPSCRSNFSGTDGYTSTTVKFKEDESIVENTNRWRAAGCSTRRLFVLSKFRVKETREWRCNNSSMEKQIKWRTFRLPFGVIQVQRF